MQWLEGELGSTPMPAANIVSRAHIAGMSDAVLRSAKKKLGLRAFQSDAGWMWALTHNYSDKDRLGGESCAPHPRLSVRVFPSHDLTGDRDASIPQSATAQHDREQPHDLALAVRSLELELDPEIVEIDLRLATEWRLETQLETRQARAKLASNGRSSHVARIACA